MRRRPFGFPAPARAALAASIALLLGSCQSPAPAPTPRANAPLAKLPVRPLVSDWRDAVLYFVIVDRFADGDPANNAGVDVAAKGTFHGGDLKGLTAQLGEIESLGVNALWITPVVQNIPGFVTGAGFPDWGYHGYWADDFDALDPRFGTEADLKALVDEAHRRGIRVLLDVVYNHAGYESRYLKDPATKGWLRSTETGCGEDDLTQCVAGLPDFKTERPEVASYLLTRQISWAKRTGVDGFRLDTVKHVSHEFWKEHRQRTRAELGKGFFLLGEVWGGDAGVLDPWFEGDELDAGFDFGFQGSAIAWAEGRGRTIAFDRYLSSREKVRPGHLLSHFLSSHDVPGALHQLGGDLDAFRLAAFLQLTASGIPCIYYGEEVGRKGGDWPDNRSAMPWGSRAVKPSSKEARNEALRSEYVKLIGLRNAHPALRRGVHKGLDTAGDVFVYERRDAASGDVVVLALNRSKEARPVDVPAPPEWSGPTREELSGTEAAVSNGRLTATLPPGGRAVWVAPKGQRGQRGQ